MVQYGHEPGSAPILGQRGQSLKAMVMQVLGARPRRCAYCASIIPVGDVRCQGCGAAVNDESPPTGDSSMTAQHAMIALLSCVIFPPALLIIVPTLFWRWLRKANRGWVLSLLICIAFPPAVLLVAPAMLWRTPAKRAAA